MIARFNTTAYAVAAGIGVVVLIGFGVVQAGVAFWAIAQGSPVNAAGGVAQYLPLISTAWSGLSCVCGSLLSVAVGALYGVWISRSGGAGPDEGAIGGAASAATAQALGSLLQSALSLIVLPFALEQAGSQLGQVFDPAIIGLSVMTSGFGALISVCSGALFGGLLGALGGVIGTFLSRRPA